MGFLIDAVSKLLGRSRDAAEGESSVAESTSRQECLNDAGFFPPKIGHIPLPDCSDRDLYDPSLSARMLGYHREITDSGQLDQSGANDFLLHGEWYDPLTSARMWDHYFQKDR